ncbi:MAG: NAD(P)/FAD-dependent oxidoreductase [Actinomycetota bacterium]
MIQEQHLCAATPTGSSVQASGNTSGTDSHAAEARRSEGTPSPGSGGLPVIIGAGFSGAVTSIMLSRQGVPHILIGAPPNSLPRLGESLNLEGSVSMLEMLPEFSRFYLTKNHSVGFLGGHALTCDFCLDRRPIARGFFRALGYVPPGGFLHLERIGLDRALYDAAVSSQYCTPLDAQVTSVDYDASTDRIRDICLSDGRVLEPSYAFDATNQGRLIGQAASVECRMISSLHRVVYTHYHADREPNAGQEQWEHATYVVRLYEKADGVDAVAWCIPLGSYISIGISCNPETCTLADEEVLELVARAYARRGLKYADRFQRRAPIMALRHKYFAHRRAYGANWMLSGPAYCQVWWMSGSGIGTALASARVAAEAIRSPLRVGRAYEDYLKELLGIHETFDWFARTDPDNFTVKNISNQSDLFIRTNVRRLAKATLTRPNRLGAVLGGLHFRLKGDSLIRGYCDVARCSLEDQTTFVLGGAAK